MLKIRPRRIAGLLIFPLFAAAGAAAAFAVVKQPSSGGLPAGGQASGTIVLSPLQALRTHHDPAVAWVARSATSAVKEELARRARGCGGADGPPVATRVVWVTLDLDLPSSGGIRVRSVVVVPSDQTADPVESCVAARLVGVEQTSIAFPSRPPGIPETFANEQFVLRFDECNYQCASSSGRGSQAPD